MAVMVSGFNLYQGSTIQWLHHEAQRQKLLDHFGIGARVFRQRGRPILAGLALQRRQGHGDNQLIR